MTIQWFYHESSGFSNVNAAQRNPDMTGMVATQPVCSDFHWLPTERFSMP